MAQTVKGKNYADSLLNRMRIPEDVDFADAADMRKYVESNDLWDVGYRMSDAQLESIYEAWKQAKPLQERGIPGRTPLFFETRSGRLLPRLASVGIRRITYWNGWRNETRYVIPGRRGLFGLQRARRIATGLQ